MASATDTPPADMVRATSTDARVVVDGISPNAAEELRQHVEDASGGGNRFVWFVLGFITAAAVGAIGALGFLALSSDDDDGQLDLDVPAVEVDVER